MGIKQKILKGLSFYNKILQEKTLQSLEEVEANTEAGHWAGAGALAELNNKLTQVRTYVGADGKLHSVDGTGADTVLNFSQAKVGSFVAELNKEHFIDIGFEPSFLCIYEIVNTSLVARWMYIANFSTTKYLAYTSSTDADTITSIGSGMIASVGSITTFICKNAWIANKTVHWVAIK